MEKNKDLIEGFIFEENKKSDQEIINPIQFEERTKSFEEKVFIILYSLLPSEEIGDDDNFSRIYSICLGRTESYNDIISKLEKYDIDIHKSIIITETKQTETSTGDEKYYLMPYKECISIYTFCKRVEEYYSDNSFDIEMYNNDIYNDGDNIINSEIKKSPMYLTPEQQEYKRMLEESLQRDKFINTMRNELNENNKRNI